MKSFLRVIIGLLGWLFSLGFTLLIIGVAVGFLMFNHYSKDLPDYSQLAKYDPATITRLYAGDGKLLAEYASEKRVFVPLEAIPKQVINAFLSAEDKNFYEHTGVDFTGLARAIRNNIVNYGQGKSLVGGSTITQQVVKNFLLTNEKSLQRKIKEAILATRISQVYSKDKILELYLNEIYLGLGSYGVAAAAQNYFNKSLDELTIEEVALLASEPKAPALYNPHKNYDAAKTRRDWVISRMLEDGHITSQQAELAIATPINLRTRDAAEISQADFFAEEVRRTLADMYGAEVLYEGGLVVKTTLNSEMQKMADNALRKALVEYDRRHGYRGAVTHWTKDIDWKKGLATLRKEHEYQLVDGQKLAVVAGADDKKAQVFFEDGTNGIIPADLMKWAGKKPRDVLKAGDVVFVAPSKDKENSDARHPRAGGDLKNQEKKDSRLRGNDNFAGEYELAQVPEVNGALVVLDPHTGKVLALSGGYAYGGTEFNRATQARRQPGSSFKPFVYLAGLENGLTPSTIILDAPVEMSQGAGQPLWKPENYHNDYLGSTTMRVGLEKSRNTMTVRLAQMIGIDKVLEIGKRFGIYDELPRNFSIVLGAAETTPLRLTNAYGMIANGGKKITPSMIERIEDRHGKTIYRRDMRECTACTIANIADIGVEAKPPELRDDREQVADPRYVYQLTSMLQGVATRGTGARSREIGKIVAGKTGTTNNSLDTWFIGFSPDLVAGVFVGYDKPHTLGKRETGASVALPAFIDFMKNALANTPDKPFTVPDGIKFVKVDLHTGLPVDPAAPIGGKTIDEAFVVAEPAKNTGNSESLESDGTQINPQPEDGTAEFIKPDGGAMQGKFSQPEVENPSPQTVGAGGLY